MGYSPGGHKEPDMTERLSAAQFRAAWSKEQGGILGPGVSQAVNQFSESSWAIDAPLFSKGFGFLFHTKS